MPNSADIVHTSPPYPKNVGCSEVYKLELELLGFVRSSTEFLSLRKATFRSHPTAADVELNDDFRDALREC
jgi:hypothetical protein